MKFKLSKEDPHSVGVVKVLLATVLWGIGYPIWKVLATEIPPLQLTAISFAIATVVMAVVFRPDFNSLYEKFKRNSFLLIVISLSGGAFGTVLILYALSVIDTGVASMMEKLQPIFALLAARIMLNERLDKKKIPYMILILPLSYAVAVPEALSFSFHGVNFRGILAAIGSAFFYGINTVLSKYLVDGRLEPKELAFFRMSLGAILIVPFLIASPYPGPGLESASWQTWAMIVAAVLISLIWAFDLFFTGLQSIPASVATFLELVTPIVALTLGIIFLGETVTKSQMIAIPLFFLCIFRISTGPKSQAEF